MALTKISTGGVKDDAASQAKIADEAIDEARLQVSNAGTNGQFLQKQSGDTGGLTWATVSVPDSDRIYEGNAYVECDASGGSDIVTVKTAGTERVRVLSNGKIGIGTTTPAKLLTVDAASGDGELQVSGSSGGRINLKDTGSGEELLIACAGDSHIQSLGAAKSIIFKTTPTGGSVTERFRIGDSGQLGIGGATYGSSGQVLTSGGASAAPSWAAVPPGGNTFTAVANGSIANNKAVKIDSDGKVSEVKISTTVLSPPTLTRNSNTVASGWGCNGGLSASFVVSGSTYLMLLSGGSNVIKGRVDKLNANRDDWSQTGTVYTVQGWQTYHMSAIFNNNLNKAAIFYGEDAGGQDSYCRVVSPNTTTTPPTMSAGSAASFTGYASNKSRHLQTVWDDDINSGDGRGIHAWLNCSNGNSQNWHLEYNTFTMANNNTFTFETSAGTNMNIFNTTNNVKAEQWQMCGCGSGRFLVIARREDGGSTDDETWFRMGTINSSSNDITWGSTGSSFSTDNWQYHRICYDETAGKVIMVARKDTDSELMSFVGTISGSGSSLSISWGSSVQAFASFSNMVANSTPKYNMVYDPALAKIVLLIPDTSGTTKIKTRVATISGTSVSWSSAQDTNWTSGGNNIILGKPSSVNGRIFLISDTSQSNATIMKTSDDVTNLTSGMTYVGFADQAYTNGQTATIKTYGNNVDTLSGLTIGNKYWVSGDGTLTPTQQTGAGAALAGIAIGTNKLLIREPDSWVTGM